MRASIIIGIAVFLLGTGTKIYGQNLDPADPVARLLQRADTDTAYSKLHGVSAGEGNTSRLYHVPVASAGHTIELELVNTTSGMASDLEVQVFESPDWIRLDSRSKTAGKLAPGSGATVSFAFSVSENAPIHQIGTLTLTASTPEAGSWTRQIRLKVSPPETFEVQDNYPNPFNPTTTIKYRLPARMAVTVTVYNLLGRKVASLADGIKPAGVHSLHWDAAGMASGLYIYRVVAKGPDGKQLIENKKMLLIK